MKRLKLYLFPLLFGWAGNCYSQSLKIDSLKILIKKDKEDSSKVNHLNAISFLYKANHYDTSVYFCSTALKLAQTINWQTGVGKSYALLAQIHNENGNYVKALQFYNKSLETWEFIEKQMYEKGSDLNAQKYFVLQNQAASLASIGMNYLHQGDYNKAIGNYIKALKISEKIGDKKRIADDLVLIAIISSDYGDYSRALKEYFEALKVYEALGDQKSIEMIMGNIGNAYVGQKNLEKAMVFYLKALKISEDLGDKDGMKYDYGYVAGIYLEQGNLLLISHKKGSDSLFSKSKKYFLKALKISEETGDKRLVVSWLKSLGNLSMSAKNYTEAEVYLNKALTLSEELKLIGERMQIESVLSALFEAKKKYAESLKHYKNYTALKDSLFNEEKNKELTRHEMNYEFEKKEAGLKAIQDKKDAVTIAESRKQKIVLILVCCMLFLVFIFAGFIFRSLRITKKQKSLIELKNKETEEQKRIIEEKNKDVMDSIHYAKRIQNALLPTEKYIEKHLKKIS